MPRSKKIRIAGDTKAKRVELNPSFDPVYGWGIQEVWQGLKDPIGTLQIFFNFSGARTSVRQSGVLHTLTANWGLNGGSFGDPSREVPQDKWELDTDFFEEDIYSNSNVYAAAGDDSTLALWKAQIEFNLTSGPNRGPLDPALTGYGPQQLELYNLRIRGVQASKRRRPVLVRSRTCSINFAGQVIVPPAETVYSTPALANAFAIPLAIYARLPGFPGQTGIPANPNPATTPTGTAWGWIARRDTSEFVLAVNKVQETKDWVYAAWSTLLYNYMP